MDSIDIIDPKTGISHSIPFEHVQQALKSGGEFANEEQKQKAMNVSSTALKSPEHGIFDYGRDIAYGLAKGAKGLGESLPNLIGGDINKNFINAIGQKQPELNLDWIKPKTETPFGNALQVGAEYAFPAGLTAKGVSKLPKIIKRLLPENPYKVIQKGYDLKKEAASKLFQSAEKKVENANAKIELPKNLISDILKIGPKTEKFKNFVEKAKDGDFKALRKLQTELFHRGERYKSSVLGSEQDMGDIIFEKRGKINDAITSELNKMGLHDAANETNQAREQWRNIEDIYHRNNMISKLVGENRKVPSSLKPLKQDAVDINNLKKAHPEIQKYLNVHKKASRALQGLGLVGIGGGLKSIYNEYK